VYCVYPQTRRDVLCLLEVELPAPDLSVAPLTVALIPFSNRLQNNRSQRAQGIHPAFSAALHTDTLQLTGAGRGTGRPEETGRGVLTVSCYGV